MQTERRPEYDFLKEHDHKEDQPQSIRPWRHVFRAMILVGLLMMVVSNIAQRAIRRHAHTPISGSTFAIPETLPLDRWERWTNYFHINRVGDSFVVYSSGAATDQKAFNTLVEAQTDWSNRIDAMVAFARSKHIDGLKVQ